MATRHASAVKAHRQTQKRTARNRAHRSRLRSALKTMRQAISTGRIDEAKAALNDTVSVIDKMSAKGIIHDNAAARYKSRIVKQLAAAQTAA